MISTIGGVPGTRLARLAVAAGLGFVLAGPAVADTLVGTYTVYYRFNAGGCFGGGNPYYCTTIPPGPIHIAATAGAYRVDVVQINNPGASGGGVQVWSGDASGGTQFTPGATGTTFSHASGEITLYYNDWFSGDNDPTAWTIVTLTKLEPEYTVTDLGPFEEPTAINEHGDVVGYRRVGGRWHAQIWRSGALTDLGTFGANDALAMNINDAGQIALTLNTATGLRNALLTGSTLTDIAPATGFSQLGLNDAGDVSGDTGGLPYFYSDGTVHQLPIGSCANGTAHDINLDRLVVGRASFGSCGGDTPAVWRNGVYQQLTPPSGVVVYEAQRVNASGQIGAYGSSLVLFEPDGNGGYSGQDLGRLAGTSSCSPSGMNDSAVMVGTCGSRAFIWDAIRGIRDLNGLADLPAGVVLIGASGVTNSGLVVARGIVNGEFRAYLLTPPATNQPPEADTGPNLTVRLGEPAVLDGSASFDDNTPTNQLLFAWQFAELPPGSAATLAAADTASPSFVPDVLGTYRVQLVVTDQGGLDSAPAQMLVSPNVAPTANAGMDSVALVGSTVALNGAATDPDGDAFTVEWTLTAKPQGSTATLYNANAVTASFVPDLPGTYVARLVARDALGTGAPDEVQVVATTAASYAAGQTQAAAAAAADLPSGAVTNAGNQNAFAQLLAAATSALDAGDLETAAQKLQQTLNRTDGCGLRGDPDSNGPGRDWIVTCDAQGEIYPLLLGALDAITP